jgi:hypothetical protein
MAELPEQLALLVTSLNDQLETVERALCLSGPPDQLAVLALRAAQGVVEVLAGLIEPLLGTDEEEAEATEDPTTCGHPETFPAPADSLCRSCGAMKQPDGAWAVT